MKMQADLSPVIIRPWPRLLDEREAAAYLGISASKFRDGWRATPARYPEPIRDGGNVLWDTKALDAHVDALAGFCAPSPRNSGRPKKWGAS
jgi:predicted DNA-binding transcriptional regulator AlpA